MEKHEEENGLCKAESVDGSLDVWSCQNSDSSSADHLVVMVHGILGSTDDWKFGAEQFVKKMPDKVFVHCSEKNVSALTLDGVDVMGERLAAEVLDIIQRKPNICKISFVAHSLGGLAARYAIGKLYKPANQEDVKDSVADSSQETPKGTICGLEAMNFITVATPHLGSMGNKQVPFLFGFSSIEKVAGLIIHWIFKRTGRHLFLKDEEEGKPPLLRRMVEDTDDCHFMCATLCPICHKLVYLTLSR
jgi:triacylglycerol esterase/lipase EstA (alpha/beta hydrolase family)